MHKKIKKITIVGGGFSGYLTALYLKKNLNLPVDITLIDNPKYKPIGVGEGTQPFTSSFLDKCGLSRKDWMKPSNATFKYGVELTGWADNRYFVDNDHFANKMLNDKLFGLHNFFNRPGKDFADWLPAYKLAKNNKSPRISEYSINLGPHIQTSEAVHFSAVDIIETIKKEVQANITILTKEIKNVKLNEQGISKIEFDDDSSNDADLYIDCTGFSSLLIHDCLNVPFINYNSVLPCDSAVAIQTPYTDPTVECHPYTKSITMDYGWRWVIPNFSYIGNGYVYSSSYITKDQAEEELRKKINNFSSSARHLNMKCGRHEKIAVKNVIAVGLSAGFIEPLEATGITFSTKVIEWLNDVLNIQYNMYDTSAENFLNNMFFQMSNEIYAFVWFHYALSTRFDTDFWARFDYSTDVSKIPDIFRDYSKRFIPVPTGDFFYNELSLFDQSQWFSLFCASNKYEDIQIEFNNDEKKLLNYFTNLQTIKVKEAIDFLPNHYEYLKSWYNE